MTKTHSRGLPRAVAVPAAAAIGAGVSVLGALAIGWRRSRSDGHPTTPA